MAAEGGGIAEELRRLWEETRETYGRSELLWLGAPACQGHAPAAAARRRPHRRHCTDGSGGAVARASPAGTLLPAQNQTPVLPCLSCTLPSPPAAAGTIKLASDFFVVNVPPPRPVPLAELQQEEARLQQAGAEALQRAAAPRGRPQYGQRQQYGQREQYGQQRPRQQRPRQEGRPPFRQDRRPGGGGGQKWQRRPDGRPPPPQHWSGNRPQQQWQQQAGGGAPSYREQQQWPPGE